MRHNRTFLVALALALVPLSAAHAHVVMQRWTAIAGYQEYVTVVVPHGCGSSPTTEVRVKIPDGISILVPEDKAGWQTRLKMRKLDTPRPGEGGSQIAEVVDEVTWTGGSIAADRLGLFNMLARMPNTPGAVIYFKTVQKCATGETRWVDTVAAGEPTWKIWATASPAPFIELQKAPGPQLGASMQEIAAERAKR